MVDIHRDTPLKKTDVCLCWYVSIANSILVRGGGTLCPLSTGTPYLACTVQAHSVVSRMGTRASFKVGLALKPELLDDTGMQCLVYRSEK